jgi:hypothetical protein
MRQEDDVEGALFVKHKENRNYKKYKGKSHQSSNGDK